MYNQPGKMILAVVSLEKAITSELDRAVEQRPVTGFFANNDLKAEFRGVKTVIIPESGVLKLCDYNRDSGFVKGAVTVTNAPVVLSMDRGRSFRLDREDNDEIGIADLAGQIMGEFVRTKVVPEVDAYCLSKLAGYAVTKNQTVTGTPATEGFAMLNEAIGKAQDAVGHGEELVAFVDAQMWKALQTSEEFQRILTVNDFQNGELTTRVTSLNGVAILTVPDSRMKTAYTFFDGVSGGEEAGGFAPAGNASSIGLLVMPKHAASLVKKTDQVHAFDQGQKLSADAWKFDYRLYYDLFIKNSMADGIYAFVY